MGILMDAQISDAPQRTSCEEMARRISQCVAQDLTSLRQGTLSVSKSLR